MFLRKSSSAGVVVATVSALVFCTSGAAQSGGPKFDVVSLKPSAPNTIARIGPTPGGERYRATGITLKGMIQAAYRVRADQIVGGPDWIDRDQFDLEARVERPSSAQELREMFKNALTERFQLQFRSETKELPAYLLTVDKGGAKLTAHPAESAGESKVDLKTVKLFHMNVVGTSASMDLFVFRMGYLLDRPMIDETGLKGEYDFSLLYTMQAPESMPVGATDHNGHEIDLSGPTIFAALAKQLGLHLEAGKGPVEIMLIGHAEKPKEN